MKHLRIIKPFHGYVPGDTAHFDDAEADALVKAKKAVLSEEPKKAASEPAKKAEPEKKPATAEKPAEGPEKK